MFSGTAVLTDPEKNVTVATFTERCDDYGAATVNVILIDPITLKGTERLAIFAKGNPEPDDSRGRKRPYWNSDRPIWRNKCNRLRTKRSRNLADEYPGWESRDPTSCFRTRND
jgi:hypothetical protein